MLVDQEKPKITFEEPVNAEWLEDPFTAAPFFVTFYPEVLAPRKAFQMDGMSPFVASVHFFEDYQLFRQHESLRTTVRNDYWEDIKRAVVHYERQQWELWDQEISTVLAENPEKTYGGRLRQMFECFEYSVQWFTFDRRDIWKISGEQFAEAKLHHGGEVVAFAEAYRSSGRLLSLWRQINALHDDLISKYPIWMPILQLRYWAKRPAALSDLVVSDKRFDELKSLYLAAFELLARLSVIALGLEFIRTSGTTDIPNPAEPEPNK